MPDEAKVGEPPDLEAWAIAQVGDYSSIVFHAETGTPGGAERAWVRVRALADHEALERDSIGVKDAYVPTADGGVALERSCDLAALAEYDLSHCVVDFRLPLPTSDGETTRACDGEVRPENVIAAVRRLPRDIEQWLRECVARVNLERPADEACLEIARRKLFEAGRAVAMSGRVDLRALLFETGDLAYGGGEAELREGRDFCNQEQVPAYAREVVVVPVAGPNVVRLVRQVLRELLMMEITRQMPGGRDWSGQPRWRVQLWEAFWQGYVQVGGDAVCWATTDG